MRKLENITLKQVLAVSAALLILYFGGEAIKNSCPSDVELPTTQTIEELGEIKSFIFTIGVGEKEYVCVRESYDDYGEKKFEFAHPIFLEDGENCFAPDGYTIMPVDEFIDGLHDTVPTKH